MTVKSAAHKPVNSAAIKSAKDEGQTKPGAAAHAKAAQTKAAAGKSTAAGAAKGASSDKAATDKKAHDSIAAEKKTVGAHVEKDLAKQEAVASPSADALFGAGKVAGTSLPTSLAGVDLMKAGASPGGEAFQLDGPVAAGMAMRLKQIVDPAHGAGVEVAARLTPLSAVQLDGQVAAWAADDGTKMAPGPFKLPTAEFKDGATVFASSDKDYTLNGAGNTYGGSPAQARRLEKKGEYVVEYLQANGTPQAYKDRVRIRVFGADDATRRKNLEAALAATKLDVLSTDADPQQAEKLRRLSVLRMVDPKTAEGLSGDVAKVSVKGLDLALSKAGVTPERLKKVTFEETFPGSFAAIDPALGESYVKAGARALMVGVRDVNSVAKILSSDGLMSSAERYSRGLIVAGGSTTSDEQTGGAEFAFLRILTKDVLHAESPKSVSSAYGSGVVQLLVTGDDLQAQLSRTDWHAYPGDKYGVSISRTQAKADPSLEAQAKGHVYSDRLVGQALIDAIDGKAAVPPSTAPSNSFATNNEICLKSGVPAAAFSYAVVASETVKTQLLESLKAAGITEIHGEDAASRIIVAPDWTAVGKALGASAA